MQENASCSFTLNGEDSLFEAADSILPGKMDTPALLRFLQEKMRVIPFGDYLQPKLTTLSQPVLEMADSIVEQLWDMIETKARGRNMLYEGKLLEKGSVKNIS